MPPGRHAALALCYNSRRRPLLLAAAPAAAAPLPHVHVQPVCCVDGGTCCHVDLLTGHQAEVKPLQNNCQGHNRLHQCKLVAHTLAGATTEGDVPAEEGGGQNRRYRQMVLTPKGPGPKWS